MKKSVIALCLMFSILSFSRLATAAVTTDCFAGWFGNATSWYADCIVWVASEPQIVGAYEVEVHNYSWADVYQNGQLIDSDSANAYAYDLINHQEVQPGVWVMSADATARLYAYKYDSNNNGVTMDELCSRGKYSYYQLGTGWIYDSSLDKEDCSVVSSE